MKNNPNKSQPTYLMRNELVNAYSWAKAVRENLEPKTFNFSQLESQSRQNARINTLESAIRDFIICLKSTSKELDNLDKLLDKEESVGKEISSIIQLYIKNTEENELLKLLKISSNPSSIIDYLVRENFPDPAAILGNNISEKLAKFRQGEYLRSQIINSARQNSTPYISHASNNLSSANSFIDMSFDNVVIPDFRRENFTSILLDEFKKTKFDKAIINAYIDASDSLYDEYAKDNHVVNPISLLQQSKNELIQNLRISIIEAHISKMKEIVNEISTIFAKLEDTIDLQRKLNHSYEINHIVQEFSRSNNASNISEIIDAREGKQNATLTESAPHLLGIAKYLSFISERFSDKLGLSLSPNFTNIGLAFGADPDTRPQVGLKLHSERDTILHIEAKKGNASTIRSILSHGANIDEMVVPLQTWGEWLYSWQHIMESVFNKMIWGTRPILLEGETPLLDAAKNLLQSTGEDKKNYLDTVLLLIDYGANLFTYDKRGYSPYNCLKKYIENNKIKISSEPSREELISKLRQIRSPEQGRNI